MTSRSSLHGQKLPLTILSWTIFKQVAHRLKDNVTAFMKHFGWFILFHIKFCKSRLSNQFIYLYSWVRKTLHKNEVLHLGFYEGNFCFLYCERILLHGNYFVLITMIDFLSYLQYCLIYNIRIFVIILNILCFYWF